jgi:NAD+ synthase (glutamine-hydrolysing)
MKNKIHITFAQMTPVPMDISANLHTMESMIKSAKADKSDLIVFPELCVSGYLLGDRFEYVDFIAELQKANDKIREMSEGLVIVWGNIVSDPLKIGEDGRMRKYNAVLIAENGKWVSNGICDGFMPKNNLPKYRIFDDARHFYPAYKLAQEKGISPTEFFKAFAVTIRGEEYKFALTVCEDMWEDEYATKLSQLYKSQNIDLLIDISASPWTLGKWHAREVMLAKRVKDVGAPIMYVNCVGLQNNSKNLIWFDGASVLVDTDGSFVTRLDTNKEMAQTVSFPTSGVVESFIRPSETAELYNNVTAAIYEFYKGFPKIVIGLSGGIDSALTLGLLRAVFPPEKILTINMPTKYNSKTTQDLARECAENFGVEYKVVPIGELFDAQVEALEKAGFSPVTTLVKENIQARLRGQQLASIAAHTGGVFTNNGNKTEVALNYFTLYGDGAGAAAFLGDLWKGQVYELSRHINSVSGKEVIPEGIIYIVPSAELSDAQNVDEGKGDPIHYEYHDKLLRAFVEYRIGITDILSKYADGSLEKYLGIKEGTLATYFKTKEEFISNLEWAWSGYNTEYKRVQLPPVLLTSRRAFGFDRRDTIAPAFFGEEYYKIKESLSSIDNSSISP